MNIQETIIQEIRIELETIIENSMRKVLNEYATRNDKFTATSLDILDIKQASQFLGLAVPTLYAKVSARSIPHSKIGKKLFFSKRDLEVWIKQGDRK